MNPSDSYLATDLSGSVQTPCGIRPLVFRYSGDPPWFGGSPSQTKSGGRGRRHTLEEMEYIRMDGRVTAMQEPRQVSGDSVAFFARPSFLIAYEVICGEPFPWPSPSNPVDLIASVEETKEKERFPQILKHTGGSWSRHDTVQAVLGSADDFLKMLAQASARIHVRGEITGCLYLEYTKDSEEYLDALDRLKEMGWLETFCTKEQSPDLLFESYEFTGLSLWERGGEDRLRSLFATGIHPLAPQTKFQDFLDHILRFKDKLKYRHDQKKCHCETLRQSPAIISVPAYLEKICQITEEGNPGKKQIVSGRHKLEVVPVH
ncbi:MAG: hypothetical protein HQL07_04980 [Nitrospirae bacterium]|nr:hypothetical protein [Magnetococcales bacterium]HAT49343.1 hypothetical protein [Alphaproteobacteria bacterium]